MEKNNKLYFRRYVLEDSEKDAHRIEAVKGFYDETLKSYKFRDVTQIALAYIDCDYYSSTSTVLEFLKDKLSHGTLIAFDDWDCYYSDPFRGQKLAFRQFRHKVKQHWHFEPFRAIRTGGMSFVCLEKVKIGREID